MQIWQAKMKYNVSWQIDNSDTSFSCQNAAKQAAAAATQTIAAAQHAASSNKNLAAQQQLVQSCKVNAHYLRLSD